MSDTFIPIPNSFQLPNVVIDYWMAKLTDSQFKVLLAICRKTWGWHKPVDMISNAQIGELTGFGKRAVIRACQDLVALGLIVCKPNTNKRGDCDPNSYGVLTRNVTAGEAFNMGKTPDRKPHRKGAEMKEGWCPQGHEGSVPRDTGVVSPGTPTKTNETKPTLSKVNDTSDEIARPQKVVGSASPSLTSSKSGKRSLFKGKAKFTDEQRDVFEWLKGMGIDSSEDTLSWWARKYSLTRLDEVHREAIKRKPDSIGAYMQKLLKSGSVVVTGRVELNAEFAEAFKALRNWNALEIHQKYASVNRGNHSIEIDFNMDPHQFQEYLSQKYDAFEGGI